MGTVFSHSGDIGDLLAALPVIRQLGGGELVLYPAAITGHRMTRERFDNLRPLLELQPYLTAVRYAAGPEGVDLDHWRHRYQAQLNLTDMVAEAFGQPHPDRGLPWLRIDRPERVARIVFARSPRYRNPYVDWRGIYHEYGAEAVFVGLPEEHHDFTRTVGPVSYRHTRDYLQLARVVSGADLVVVNQTSIRWLAEAFKVPVLVEVDNGVNNTHWERDGAFYLFGQGALPRVQELEDIAIRSAVRRALGRTLLSHDRLASIAALVRGVRHLGGEMAELGCYRGGSAAVIASCCPEKRLRLFDTWDGIPEDDAVEGGHERGEFAAPLDEVREYLRLFDAEFFPGTFPATAPDDDVRYAFVHLDGNTYQSTLAGLRYFLPRLVEGGVLVLNGYDWPTCPGVRKAVEDMRPHPIADEVQTTVPLQARYRR